jgi:hypothetical protein
MIITLRVFVEPEEVRQMAGKKPDGRKKGKGKDDPKVTGGGKKKKRGKK